jgi:excisionase family DNA binding protein
MRLRSTSATPEKLAHSIDAAALVADVGKSTIKNAIAEGELAVVEVGTRRLVLHEDLHEYLLKRRTFRANGSSGSADPPTHTPPAPKADAPPGLGAEGPSLEKLLRLRVDELGLGGRLRGALANDGIVYVGQLVELTETDLMRMPNVGHVSIAQVKKVLARHKLRLGIEIAAPEADRRPNRLSSATAAGDC